jgi:hypothetical protein
MEQLVKALHEKVRTLPRNQQLMGFATGMLALDEQARHFHTERPHTWLFKQVLPDPDSWLGKFVEDFIKVDDDATEAVPLPVYLDGARQGAAAAVAGETTEPIPAGPTAVASVAPQEQ